jgi:AcrR family transcriptional regulator
MSSPRLASTARIFQAAVRCVLDIGAADMSMADIAREAGVSKGLIHYHFTDKAALLARLVEWLSVRIADRERAALENVAANTAIDAMWTWLEGELASGELLALIILSQDHSEDMRAVVRASARLRRDVGAATVESLFNALALRPRVPIAMMADVVIAFVDGLAIATASDPDSNPRVAFDVFWLAMLSLAE